MNNNMLRGVGDCIGGDTASDISDMSSVYENIRNAVPPGVRRAYCNSFSSLKAYHDSHCHECDGGSIVWSENDRVLLDVDDNCTSTHAQGG